MLVLTLKESEHLIIGDDIKVHVERAAPGKWRVAVDAPRHIQVTRSDAKNKEPRTPKGSSRFTPVMPPRR